MNYRNALSHSTANMKSSLIRELVAQTKSVQGLISFAGGFPSPATFPKDILSKLYQEVVATEGSEILQYGASEGDLLLKEELRKWEGYPELSMEQMLITVGSTNAIYYYAKSLVDEGDVVLCEAPSFLGSVVAFDALGARICGIPMDNEGIKIDVLKDTIKAERKCGKRIKFLYTIPDFQNPSGISMSLARRKELLQVCSENDIPILEDNPYSRLRYSGESLPTLFKLSRDGIGNNDIVTEIVSFSKILGPGPRFGYAKGPKDLIERMGSWQQKINVSPDCVTQRVIARFLQAGYMDPHIKSICVHYKPFLEKMLHELEMHMPSEIKWTKPEGGIFLWLWLPQHINADLLFKDALEQKVTFIPGSKFYPFGAEEFNCMRLNYTFSTEVQIEAGIKSLAALLKSQLT